MGNYGDPLLPLASLALFCDWGVGWGKWDKGLGQMLIASSDASMSDMGR